MDRIGLYAGRAEPAPRPILSRNATTWIDDRRAAAFVTTKDPAVLLFSKNVSSMVKGKVKGEINSNLLIAMALFEALQLYGLTYSRDPIPTVTSNNQVLLDSDAPARGALADEQQSLFTLGEVCSPLSCLRHGLRARSSQRLRKFADVRHWLYYVSVKSDHSLAC